MPTKKPVIQINRNMGCIEIYLLRHNEIQKSTINRNMGCIEIFYRRKFIRRFYRINRNMGCIEIGFSLLMRQRLS